MVNQNKNQASTEHVTLTLSDNVSAQFLDATKLLMHTSPGLHATLRPIAFAQACWAYIWRCKDQAGHMLCYIFMSLSILVVTRFLMLLTYNDIPKIMYRDVLAPILASLGVSGAALSPLTFLESFARVLTPSKALPTFFPFLTWHTKNQALFLPNDLLVNTLMLPFLVLTLWALSKLSIQWMRAISGTTPLKNEKQLWHFFFYKSTGKLFLYTLTFYGALSLVIFVVHALLQHSPGKVGWHAMEIAFYFFLSVMATRLSLVTPLIAHEIRAPLRQSWHLTKGHVTRLLFGHVLFLIPVFLFTIYGIGSLFADLLTSHLRPNKEEFVWSLLLANTLIYILLVALPALFNTYAWGALAQIDTPKRHTHILRGT